MGRPNLSRETDFSGANGDKEVFPCSADHVNRVGNLPVDLYSAIWYSYFTCIQKNLNTTVLPGTSTSYWYTAAILASFFLFACLRRCFTSSLNLSNRNNNKKQRRPAKNTPPGQQTSYCVYYSDLGLLCLVALHGNQHIISVQYNSGLLPRHYYTVDSRLLPSGNPFK